MGFEVAIVVAIFLVSGLVLGSSYYGAIHTADEVVEDARADYYTLQQEKLQTSLAIGDIQRMGSDSSHSLLIDVTNDGSISTNGEIVNLIIDGELVSASYLSPYEIILPGETVSFLVDDLSGNPHKIKIVSESGVSTYGNYSN
ncbi:flagellar protein FlaF [Methanohalophilus levihalophilus]|uniref:hypothetical protein n=1 Tax=Methanohalophilus levihalophilus TaxID=1431282 RepID=UPI001AE678C8|nr:hypothetical protein [Methanohalophilus levihalophilus]MBP2029977.1 flagellar protein FlaF [Methanohalophilus levihalophilus]